MNRLLLTWFLPLLFLPAGCGNGDGGGIALGSLGGTDGGTGGTESRVFLYVTNSDSNNISGFSINAVTGGLVALSGSPFPAGSGPSAIAVSSNGFWAYVANGQANGVTAFSVSTEGSLLALSSTTAKPNPVSVDKRPSALILSPDTQFLYVANRDSGTVTTFSIGAGGVLTLVAQTGTNTNPVSVLGSSPDSLALSSDGKFLYVGNSGSNEITAFSIASSGLLAKIPPTGTNTNPLVTGGTILRDIVASPNAPFLYAVHDSSNTVTAFHMESNGLLTLVSASGGSQNPILAERAAPTAVMLSRDGRFLYSANGTGTITAFAIGGNGLLTLVQSSGGQVNPVSTGTSPVAMTLSPDGQHLYVANSGGLIFAYTIAGDTGLLTPLNAILRNPFQAGTRPSGIATSGSR